MADSNHCYSYYSRYWNTHVVNSTSFTVDVTYYGTAYEFEITVITSRGRGSPYKLNKYVQPLNGKPSNFSCQRTAVRAVFTCRWYPPTDFNPTGFYVSSNLRHSASMFWVVNWQRTRFSHWHRRLGRNRDLKVQRLDGNEKVAEKGICVLSVLIAIMRKEKMEK